MRILEKVPTKHNNYPETHMIENHVNPIKTIDDLLMHLTKCYAQKT
jgi:hypothetical protein